MSKAVNLNIIRSINKYTVMEVSWHAGQFLAVVQKSCFTLYSMAFFSQVRFDVFL
jgi:hypothetical protein